MELFRWADFTGLEFRRVFNQEIQMAEEKEGHVHIGGRLRP